MSSLAELPDLVGFFSYSREDDEDSHGALSALRDRIQRELRGQLGRSMKTFHLWQDREAIAPGKLWEGEIKTAVGQAVFFIPIITPTVVRSEYCRFELESFLARESELGRNDLVFPILYIRVPELDDGARSLNDPVLSIIAKRQYLDWREFRHRDVLSPDISAAVERFCTTICNALSRSAPAAGERSASEASMTASRPAAAAQAARRVPEQEPKPARGPNEQTARAGNWRSAAGMALPPLRLALIGGAVAAAVVLGGIVIWSRFTAPAQVAPAAVTPPAATPAPAASAPPPAATAPAAPSAPADQPAPTYRPNRY